MMDGKRAAKACLLKKPSGLGLGGRGEELGVILRLAKLSLLLEGKRVERRPSSVFCLSRLVC